MKVVVPQEQLNALVNGLNAINVTIVQLRFKPIFIWFNCADRVLPNL